jgi:hypothetical protein
MRLPASVLVASVLISTPVHAQGDWVEYNFQDLGIRKDYPVEPTRSRGTYTTDIVKDAPSTILTAEQDGIIYRTTVVELQNRATEGATIMGECNYNSLVRGAKALGDFSTEIGGGARGIYGRWTSVDMENGDRIMSACYFTTGRLYFIEAVVTPRHPFHPASALAFRFVNALDFNTDPNRDAPRPPAGGAAAGRAGGGGN